MGHHVTVATERSQSALQVRWTMKKTWLTKEIPEIPNITFLYKGELSLAIFWLCEAKFCSSGWFFLDHEEDKPTWTVRCWLWFIFSVLLTGFASMTWSPALEFSFRHIWPCLIINVLATQAEFVQLLSYCTFTFHITNYCPSLNPKP